jgi:flagellar hook-length control protein FliK
MNNLPISNAQPSANPKTSAHAKGDNESSSGLAFGAVLSRQFESKNTSAAGSALQDTRSTEAQATEPQGEPKKSNGKTKTDKLALESQADLPPGEVISPNAGDAANALLAMLQIPQPIVADSAALGASSQSMLTGTETDSSHLTAIKLTKSNATPDGTELGISANPASTQGKSIATGSSKLLPSRHAGEAALGSPHLTSGMDTTGARALEPTAFAAMKPDEWAAGILQSAANQSTAPTILPAANAGMLASNLITNQAGNNPLAINTPLTDRHWPDDFSQKINWMSTQQNQVAELHLNPPDLGPMNVVLKVTDNQATALFTSPHSAVRDAIENALPKLREILADSGIMLGNATVSDQAPRDNGASAFMNSRGNASPAGISTDNDALAKNDLSLPVQSTTARRHNGMVDTFA